MNRIEKIFQERRGQGRKTLMPFITAGDPDLATTVALLPALEAAGASICELGIPFSDPIADGPIIQDSMNHALTHGFRPAALFEQVATIRPKLKLGLVAMVSFSIVHRMGLKGFITQSKQAGMDGFIFPDLPVEEAGPVCDAVRQAELICSFLISPTTPAVRAEKIAQACSGFVYVLARAGVTGERSELPTDLEERLRQLRQVTDLPMAVGFGVSSGAQVKQVVKVADAAIVGSAIMRRVQPMRGQPSEMVVREVGGFVKELAMGLE